MSSLNCASCAFKLSYAASAASRSSPLIFSSPCSGLRGSALYGKQTHLRSDCAQTSACRGDECVASSERVQLLLDDNQATES